MGDVFPVLSRKLEKSTLILGKIVNLWVKFPNYRSSHRRCSVRKGVLRTLAKFTGKYLCQSLFFNKVACGACNLIKKETLAQVFSCEFCQISENTFLHRTPLLAAFRIFLFSSISEFTKPFLHWFA